MGYLAKIIFYETFSLSFMEFADHHIHSCFSRCCIENYTIKEIISKLDNFKPPYYCISDHVHYDNDDAYFFKTYNMAQDILGFIDKPLYLGAEITFIDEEGNIPFFPRSQSKLNYTLMGDHFIPRTGISMENTDKGKSILYSWITKDEDTLRSMIKIIESMYLCGIKKNTPHILVHPFSTLLRCDFTHIFLYDVFEKVCEVCQETKTAIELNRAQIEDCLIHPTENLIFHPDIPPKTDFYHNLIKILAKYDVKVALGSDAHRIKDVGNIILPLDVVKEFGISPERILNLHKNGISAFNHVS